ncbi:MAG: alpha/beta hydrolase-fold protein [Bacteroidota bacterium]
MPLGSFRETAFAGFSLGGLMALDIVWSYPKEFSRAGIFSGSLWWRNIDQQEKEYDDDKHRIIHQLIRKGKYQPGLKFFFQCGNMDEVMDRNNNGIIDSIDDTLDLIKELEAKGYDAKKDICYLEMSDGKHDIPTWGRAMPGFLKWGWGMRES